MARTVPRESTPTVGELVGETMGRLAPSERKVARALLAAYPIAGLESLTQLAARAGVTGPTVMRFVRKLGFEGYPDFQRVLREEVQARMSSPLSLYERRPTSSMKGFLGSSLRVLEQGLEETVRAIPPAEFHAVVELLATPRRRILCTGGRFSQIVAHYLWAHLKMLRTGAVLVGAGFDPRVDELIDVRRPDVLAVFDYRRYQEDTVAFARRAAERGATVVLFTDPWLSPIAEVADHVLISSVEAPSPFDSLTSAFALVEALVGGLVIRLGKEARRRVEDLESVRALSDAGAGQEDGSPGGRAPAVVRPLKRSAHERKGGGPRGGRRS